MMNAEEVQEVMDAIRSHYKSLQSPDFSFVRDTLSLMDNCTWLLSHVRATQAMLSIT